MIVCLCVSIERKGFGSTGCHVLIFFRGEKTEKKCAEKWKDIVLKMKMDMGRDLKLCAVCETSFTSSSE